MGRHGQRFLIRCFRPGEIPSGREPDAATVAGRWAAKEAVLKALGAGIRGVPYRDVEILPAVNGPPGVRLHGAARDLQAHSGGGSFHLSISHERGHALAIAILTR